MKTILQDKKGNGFMNGFLIVLLAMGIGTICIAYMDSKKQPIIEEEEFSTIITVEDSINVIENSNGYKYRTNISLGEMGNATLSEETISKELAIYSGTLNYSTGETYGIRVTITNGKDVSFGFSQTESIPLVFMEYLKEAAIKMYEYRFK